MKFQIIIQFCLTLLYSIGDRTPPFDFTEGSEEGHMDAKKAKIGGVMYHCPGSRKECPCIISISSQCDFWLFFD